MPKSVDWPVDSRLLAAIKMNKLLKDACGVKSENTFFFEFYDADNQDNESQDEEDALVSDKALHDSEDHLFSMHEKINMCNTWMEENFVNEGHF